jgi:hypothetical protein
MRLDLWFRLLLTMKRCVCVHREAARADKEAQGAARLEQKRRTDAACRGAESRTGFQRLLSPLPFPSPTPQYIHPHGQKQQPKIELLEVTEVPFSM